jgi:hypothetical protein
MHLSASVGTIQSLTNDTADINKVLDDFEYPDVPPETNIGAMRFQHDAKYELHACKERIAPAFPGLSREHGCVGFAHVPR